MPFDPSTDPHNVTDAVFGAAVPSDFATLRADESFGDGHYSGDVFEPWQYVVTLDGVQSFYDGTASIWVVGATPPLPPYSGGVIADLDTLRVMLGAKNDADDGNLDRALIAATEWTYERCMRCDWDHPDVQYAILLGAARLYQRRKSPEGVNGFGAEGVVMRFLADDPDIVRLLTLHLEMHTAGIG